MFGIGKSKKSNFCEEGQHRFTKILKRSNIIQYSTDGYPLRLCIYECEKCKKTEQLWIDTVATKSDYILKWQEVEGNFN